MSWDVTIGDTTPFETISVNASPEFVGTEQQENFFLELLTGTGNVVLEARAGTGKSTTCREAMGRVLASDPRASLTYVAFNKPVADDFRKKSPRAAKVSTFHSLCWSQLAPALGVKEPSGDKTFTILDTLGWASGQKRYLRKSISRVVSLAKNLAFNPDSERLDREVLLEDIISEYDIECWNQEETVIQWADRVLEASVLSREADFDDMLWMTYLHQLEFPHCDILFIDEAQDLNPIQHALLRRLNPTGRTVAVGDRYQSIYGFRGADVESIPRLIETLKAEVLPLTVTFRCPTTHVDYAKEIVPDFQAAPGNLPGTLTFSERSPVSSMRPGDLVLCPKNAPLVSACLEAVKNRVPAYVRGRYFGDSLGSIIRSNASSQTMSDFIKGVERWAERKLEVLSDKDGREDQVEKVKDQRDAIIAVSESCAYPCEVSDVVSRIFDDSSSTGRVCFSSVHRAKGLEARKVIYLTAPIGRSRKKKEATEGEMQQARNLEYVARTRSLDTLEVIGEEKPCFQM